MRQALPDQHDCFPQSTIELCQLGFQPQPSIDVAAVRWTIETNQHRQALLGARPRDTASVMIAASVHHDPHEPGPELGLALEAPDLLHERATDLLRDVVRIRSR